MIDAVSRNLFTRIDLRRPRHLVPIGRRAKLPDPIGGFGRKVLKIRILVRDRFELLLAPQIFPDRDVFHFRCNDPLIGIPFLGNRMPIGCFVLASFGTQRFSFQAGIFFKPIFCILQRVVFLGVRFGQVAIVLGLHLSAGIFFHVTAIQNPLQPHRRQPLRDVATVVGISPRPRAIVNMNGRILFNRSVGMLGIGKANLSQRNFHLGMDLTLNVNPG